MNLPETSLTSANRHGVNPGSTADQLLLYSGLIMALLLVIGLWPLAGFVPPPNASDSAGVIFLRFRQNQQGIIGGSLMIMIGSTFFILFCLAVTDAIERHNPRLALLARAQLVCAGLNALMFIMVALFWMVAAFRSDSTPADVRLFNDMAWIIMVAPTGPFIVQQLIVAVAAFSNSSRTVIPRWCGYFNLWCALTMLPGMFSGFFKTGIIAWHGLLSFWLEGAVFLLWIVVMTWALRNLFKPKPGT